jgi:hypothetical protein
VNAMTYESGEARQGLLETVAEAIDEIGFALASLGAAYEQLDEYSADKLEAELFGPTQTAYGRAKRAYAEFATRHGLTTRTFEPQEAGLPSTRAKGFVENAVEAAGTADSALAGLQDSEVWVEMGDQELRAGLAEVRDLIGGLRGRAREFLRTLGR